MKVIQLAADILNVIGEGVQGIIDGGKSVSKVFEDALFEAGSVDPQLTRYALAYFEGHRVPMPVRLVSHAYRYLPQKSAIDLPSHTRSGDSHATVVARKEEALKGAGREDLMADMQRMAKGPLGFFIIAAQGLDWEHTDWLFNPNILGLVRFVTDKSSFEPFLFSEAPTVRATQERFVIFQEEAARILQERNLDNGKLIGSLPSGRMRDLLTLETGDQSLTRVALDRDPEALLGASELSRLLGVRQVSYQNRDALDLNMSGTLSLLLSNGLNIYLNDRQVAQMYGQAREALIDEEYFIVSQITPPSEWQAVKPSDAALQRRLMNDVAGAKWELHLRTTEQTVAQLQDAGFDVSEVRRDSRGIFPTFITQANHRKKRIAVSSSAKKKASKGGMCGQDFVVSPRYRVNVVPLMSLAGPGMAPMKSV